MIKLALTIYVLILLFAVTHPVLAAAVPTVTTLAGADHEIALIYKSGLLIATFEGDDRSTLVPLDPRFRDGELWHSHVYPGTPDLSPFDLWMAKWLKLKKMCAVSIEMTCCAERIGATWGKFSRAQAQRMTAEINDFFRGRERPVQIAFQHAYIAASAVTLGATYACW